MEKQAHDLSATRTTKKHTSKHRAASELFFSAARLFSFQICLPSPLGKGQTNACRSQVEAQQRGTGAAGKGAGRQRVPGQPPRPLLVPLPLLELPPAQPLTLAMGRGSASPPRLPKSLFQPCPRLQMDELRATLNHTFSLELAPSPPSIASPGLASTAIGFIIMPCCPNSLRTQFSTDMVTLCHAGSLRAGSAGSHAPSST